MKKKTLLIRLCKVVSLVLAVVLTLLFLQEFVLCRADNNRERIKGFYMEEKDSVDVVMIGASEIYAGYAAPLAYSLYGYTSYPYATQGNTILNYITCVKEAIRTQHPRLLVIEINGALYDDQWLDKEVYLRYLADNMPNNENKRALTEQFDFYDQTEAWLPLWKYHDVWEDFPNGLDWSGSLILSRLRGHNRLKGVTTTTNIYQNHEKLYNTDPTVKKTPLAERCQKAFIELLEYCKSEKLNVIFVRFPHLVNLKGLRRLRRSYTAEELIRSYGFEYIGLDGMLDEIGLDIDHDFYNPEHVNIYGQKKLTEYLGRRIASLVGEDRYQLSENAREEWDESVRYYDAFGKLADEIIRNNGEVIRVAEDIVNLYRMKKYLE